MRRVLVLGGYGGFGRGVCLGLHRQGFEVIVAGRSLAKAEAFCAGRAGMIPALVERQGDWAEAIRRHGPWAVVDAAGPFQGMDYRVPAACVAAGVHYADLADAGDFVAGVAVLDSAARIAGVAVISGASSTPAFSGAVVRRLTEGLGRVDEIEISISASNRATAGPSVTSAILSYVGRPLRQWRGGR